MSRIKLHTKIIFKKTTNLDAFEVFKIFLNTPKHLGFFETIFQPRGRIYKISWDLS